MQYIYPFGTDSDKATVKLCGDREQTSSINLQMINSAVSSEKFAFELIDNKGSLICDRIRSGTWMNGRLSELA